MSDPILPDRNGGLTLQEIVALTGAKSAIQTGGEPAIRGAAALELAGPEDITFADRLGDTAILAVTQAGACFVTAELGRALPTHTIALISADPYRAFVQVANALHPDASRPSSLFELEGKAGSATIHSSARVEPNVTIDPSAMIGPRAEIGSGTVIGPMAVIGPGVCIGRHCAIGASASIVHALIGDKVIIHAGCRLGDYDPANSPVRGESPAHLGRVVLQDGVQLGANCTIDRGSHLDTVIGEHTVVGNLVQIPADISIGRHCVISRARHSQANTSGLLSALDVNGIVPDHTAIDT
jgi:UDP-3-O-[3-hydroxymyristoyl] glucosamine N-acyltransferase